MDFYAWSVVAGRINALAKAMQLDRSCLRDRLSQERRPSLVAGLGPARAPHIPRLAKESASQSLPSQLNCPGLGLISPGWISMAHVQVAFTA